MHKPIDWTDLRYMLALARAGSLAAAARTLRVSHTTVLRRVGALEASQGVRLFERLRTGYVLTAGGEEMLAAAQSMAEVVTDLERRLAGQDLRLEGLVRIATVDTLVASLLPPLLAGFQEEHPGVVLELTTSADLADLAHRDADVAIRVSDSPPEQLVGRRIGPVGLAIYGARGTAPRALRDDELPAQRWVGPSDALAGANLARWMRDRIPAAQVVLQADSIVGLAQAAAAGIGIAALPCYLGEVDPGLERVSAGRVALDRPADLWVLTHQDLRSTARVRALTRQVGDGLARLRDRISGDDLV